MRTTTQFPSSTLRRIFVAGRFQHSSVGGSRALSRNLASKRSSVWHFSLFAFCSSAPRTPPQVLFASICPYLPVWPSPRRPWPTACGTAGVLGGWVLERRSTCVQRPGTDGRRLEVAVDGLPLWNGAQFAIDTTMVPSSQRRHCSCWECSTNGKALDVARARKARRHPELSEAQKLVDAPFALGGSVPAWLRRWQGMLGCATRAFAEWLLEGPATGGTDGLCVVDFSADSSCSSSRAKKMRRTQLGWGCPAKTAPPGGSEAGSVGQRPCTKTLRGFV